MLFRWSYVRTLILTWFLLLASHLSAQIYPSEAASFYALRIPFRAEKIKDAHTYTFKFARSRYDQDAPFEKAVFLKTTQPANVVIADLPEFDLGYSWQVEYFDAKGRKIKESEIFHFRTLGRQGDKYRVRVIEDKYRNKDLFFFADYADGLFNMEGKAIWNLPSNVSGNEVSGYKSDVELTSQSTVTFLAGNKAFEIDYNGQQLWEAPPVYDRARNVPMYNYHHELTRLKNGNYMVIASVLLDRKIPPGFLNPPKKDSVYNMIDFGVLVEYDATGRQVWSWRSSEYFTDEQIFRKKFVDGRISPNTHMNAFCFDEARSVIYCGFKDINKIVKIKYPENKVLAEYSGTLQNGERIFQKQHTIGVNAEGNLYIFNNNNGRMANFSPMEAVAGEDLADSIAEVTILREYGHDSVGYEKVWDFKCNFDRQAPAASSRAGNVSQLRDGNYFVCMGGTPRIFIVTAKKEVLFNAIVEKWDDEEQQWKPFPQYRATPVYADDLDKLIFTALPE